MTQTRKGLPNPERFLRNVAGVKVPGARTAEPLTRLGEVIVVSPLQVLWEGDVTSDDMEYEHNQDYTPVEGDRVLGIKVGATYVVLCKIG